MDQHDSRYWVEIDSARKPAVPPQVRPIVRPSRSRERRGEILSLLLLSLFLVDTFLPWQQQCFSLGGLGVRVALCLSANAWSGTAGHVGQAAGIFAIATIAMLGVRLGGVDLGQGGRVALRVGVYGTAAAGSLKWIMVIWRLPAYGAWVGLILLLAMAGLDRWTGWLSAERSV
jgi:hypothetical protein